jgi:hypothetical protein
MNGDYIVSNILLFIYKSETAIYRTFLVRFDQVCIRIPLTSFSLRTESYGKVTPPRTFGKFAHRVHT